MIGAASFQVGTISGIMKQLTRQRWNAMFVPTVLLGAFVFSSVGSALAGPTQEKPVASKVVSPGKATDRNADQDADPESKLTGIERDAIRKATASPIRVGTIAAPPFSYQEDGVWDGLSFALWRRVAEVLGIDYTIKAYSIENMMEAVEKNEVDIVVSDLNITADRDRMMRFGHTFHHSGYGVVTRDDLRPRFAILDALFSRDFLYAVGSLVFLLLVIGTLVWIFERRAKGTDFGGGIFQGLGSGLWWSAVTMSTVGYGDKSPRTVSGRVIATIWIFASVVVISSFTAAIASSLTVGRMVSSIQEIDDLRHRRVGVVQSASAQEYLKDLGFRPTAFPDISALLDGVEKGEVEAVVHDEPVLRYLLTKNPRKGVRMQRVELGSLSYAFAYPVESGLARPVGIEMLEIIESESWPALVRRYLGEAR